MSKRRQPGELVKRQAGTAGFINSSSFMTLRVPSGKEYEFDRIVVDEKGQTVREGEAEFCMMGCGDPECREWANVDVVSGPFSGQTLYHVSECQMEDIA